MPLSEIRDRLKEFKLALTEDHHQRNNILGGFKYYAKEFNDKLGQNGYRLFINILSMNISADKESELAQNVENMS